MKRIFLICISLLTVFSLCACGNDDVQGENPENLGVQDVEETPTAPSEVDIGNDIILKGDFLEEYSDPKFDGLDINKFLGTAIVKIRPEEYQIADIPVISPDSPNADLVFTLLHLKSEYLESYAISASSSSTRAYTLAIMQSAPYCEELIVSAIENRMADLYSQVKDYPDQLHLVENTIVTQVGDFVLFIICDNARLVLEELTKVMHNTDLNTIETVPYMTEEERKAIEDEAFGNETSDLFEDVGEVVVTPVEDDDVDNSTSDNGNETPEVENTDSSSVDNEE